jgi:hypothetical protein
MRRTHWALRTLAFIGYLPVLIVFAPVGIALLLMRLGDYAETGKWKY